MEQYPPGIQVKIASGSCLQLILPENNEPCHQADGKIKMALGELGVMGALVSGGRLDRRLFIKIGSIVALTALLSSCIIPPVATEKPLSREWEKMSDSQKIFFVENGGLFDKKSGEEKLLYINYFNDYLLIILERIFDCKFPSPKYVSTDFFIKKYREFNNVPEDVSDEEVIGKITAQQVTVLISSDEGMYIWDDSNSIFSKVLKPLRIDLSRNPTQLDTFAIALRIAITHKIIQACRAWSSSVNIPDDLQLIEASDGLFVVTKIQGFSLQGEMITSEVDEYVKFELFDDVAALLITEHKTVEAGLYYNNFTNYSKGVEVLKQILERTRINYGEFSKIREEEGLPGLYIRWQNFGLNNQQISELMNIVTTSIYSENSQTDFNLAIEEIINR